MNQFAKYARAVPRALFLWGLVVIAACDSGTAPPKAVTIVFDGDVNQSGEVGQALSPAPRIEIRDDKGNALSGIAFTVTVSGGGSLTGAPAKTTNESTALGTWTLGTTAGPQTLTVQSAGVTPLTISATALAGAPAVATTGGVPQNSGGVVGTVSASSPQIKLTDAFGNPVAGFTISVQVTGGGSVQNPSPVTNSAGLASVGTWTLGTVPGQQRVTLSAGSTVAPLVYTATVDAGQAVAVSAVGTVSAAGTAGAIAPISPAIKLVDSFGNGVAGVHVTLTLAPGSGSVTNPNPVTDATGAASAGVWTLGPGAGVQKLTLQISPFAAIDFTVTVTVNQFSIEVRFVDGTPPAAAQAAFLNAAARIQKVIVGDLPDIAITPGFNVVGCFNGLPGGVPSIQPLNETIDDLVIFARIVTDDGPGNRLGVGGPCAIRSTGGLPVIGVMVFDIADVNNPVFPGVVLHEMLHAVGIGTLWQGGTLSSLAQGLGGVNPIFLGAQARQQFVNVGGTTPTGVPIENVGGPGTADGHWRQSNLFGNELMTGTIFGTLRPFSAVTMAALADFGYTVSLATAEPFTLLSGAGVRAGEETTPVAVLGNDAVLPRFSLDPSGRVSIFAPPPLPAAPIKRH